MKLSSVGGQYVLGESCRGDATRATLNSTAVCLRAMLRRSPCHRGRVHFDFSEEVVKRLHTSTLRLELTPSFTVSVTFQTLSGSHAFTHCLLLSLSFFFFFAGLLSLQLRTYVLSTTLNMGHYLPISSPVYVMNFCPFL